MRQSIHSLGRLTGQILCPGFTKGADNRPHNTDNCQSLQSP